MVRLLVFRPSCRNDRVVKRGTMATAQPRSRCQNEPCSHPSCLRDPTDKGRQPEVNAQVLEMSLNGRGVRDTARVLPISTATIMQESKKRAGSCVGQSSPAEKLYTQ